jgi:CBS domain-containing protein
MNVARLMCDRDCGEIPVVADTQAKTLVGVITDRDITCRTVAAGRNPLELTAGDCMSSPVVAVRLEMDLDVATQLMESRQIRRTPVVDQENACVGILSQADLARHAPAAAGRVLQHVSRPSA